MIAQLAQNIMNKEREGVAMGRHPVVERLLPGSFDIRVVRIAERGHENLCFAQFAGLGIGHGHGQSE